MVFWQSRLRCGDPRHTRFPVCPPATINSLTAPYNDRKAVEQLFDRYPEDVAAVIVEPVAANMGVASLNPTFCKAFAV